MIHHLLALISISALLRGAGHAPTSPHVVPGTYASLRAVRPITRHLHLRLVANFAKPVQFLRSPFYGQLCGWHARDRAECRP